MFFLCRVLSECSGKNETDAKITNVEVENMKAEAKVPRVPSVFFLYRVPSGCEREAETLKYQKQRQKTSDRI